MSSGRRQKTIGFTPPEVTAVAGELAALRVAGGGWINLLPGIDEEASDVHPGRDCSPSSGTTRRP